MEIDENVKMMLDIKLQMINEHISENPEVTLTYFVSDLKKLGGKYVTVTGVAKKIDNFKNTIMLQNGTEICISDILEIDSDICCI